jgi:hypothetical protein
MMTLQTYQRAPTNRAIDAADFGFEKASLPKQIHVNLILP